MALYDSQIQDVLGRAATPQEQNALKYDPKNKSYNVSIDDLTKFKSNLAKTPAQTNIPGYSFQGNDYEYQTRKDAYGNPYTLPVLKGTPQPVTDVRNEAAITPSTDVVGDQIKKNYYGIEDNITQIPTTQGTQPPAESLTLKAYKDVQSKIADIDKAINDSYLNKKKEIEAQGGIVNETQLRAQIANEQAPLINQRKTLATSQANLSKQYQQELAAQRVAAQAAAAQSNADYRNATLGLRREALDVSTLTKAEQLALQKAKFAQSQSSGLGDSTYTSDLEKMVSDVATTISSQNQRNTYINNIRRARNDADKISTMAAVILQGAPSDEKKDFNNQTTAIKQIDKAIALIDSGVKTGVVQNGQQYLFNLFGKDYDPKLAQLRQLITSAVQPYRNSVTGAAWGTQEEGEYQSLFGSTKYSPEELKQRLEGIKQIMKDKTVSALNTYVNPLDTYSNPFADVPSNNATNTPEYAQSVVNTVIQNAGLTGSETLAQALAKNPNKFVDAIIAQEGGSLPNVKNNPGNIKFKGLPGQTDSGVVAKDGGTFASYASPTLGRQAILNLLKGYNQNQPVTNAIAAYKGVKDAYQGGSTPSKMTVNGKVYTLGADGLYYEQ